MYVQIESRSHLQIEDSLPIVKPFDIALQYTNYNSCKQNINIDIHSISMLFSYQDFKMTMAILNSLQPPPQENAKQVQVAAPSTVNNVQQVVTVGKQSEKVMNGQTSEKTVCAMNGQTSEKTVCPMNGQTSE